MEQPPIHFLIESARAQKKLIRENKRLRKRLEETRRGLDEVVDKLAQVRGNPLTRPFVRSSLIDQVRTLKKQVSKQELNQEDVDPEAEGLESKYPGITLPKAIQHTYDLQANRLRQPKVALGAPLARPRLNILFPDLDPKIIFGGYGAAFEFLAALHGHVDVRLVTTSFPCEGMKALVDKYDGNPRLSAMLKAAEYFDISDADSALPVGKGDVFCAYSFWDCLIAQKLAALMKQERFIYFCQEDETVFHDYSTDHALGRQAQALPQFTIFNTEILRSYFRTNRLGIYRDGAESGDANSISFQHALVPVEPASMDDYQSRTKARVLCYARPETHAKRNLFEMSLMALTDFTRLMPFTPEEVEFIGVGSLHFQGDIPLANDHQLKVIPKLELNNYAKALAGFDIGLSLMYAPHPSILPFEMASAGLVTVTNTFGVRDEKMLTGISTNLVPARPELNALTQALVTAWERRKDYAARVAGSKLDWSRSWETSFNPPFRDEVLKRIRGIAAS
jgi:hypothetical protein